MNLHLQQPARRPFRRAAAPASVFRDAEIPSAARGNLQRTALYETGIPHLLLHVLADIYQRSGHRNRF